MPNSRFPVGLDIDDVLLWYKIDLFFDYLEEHLNWRVDRELFARTHDFNKATGGKTVAQVTPAFTQFLLRHPNVQSPVPGVYQTLQQLAPLCSFHGITARAVELRDVTLGALKQHCSGISFASFAWGRCLTKADILQEWNIQAYVEDSTREIELILDRGIDVTVIQFPAFKDCPQRGFKDSRVVRLAACDHVQDANCLADQEQLWQHAWSQTQQEIQQLIPALSSIAP